MIDKRSIARRAVAEALRFRQRAGINLHDPACVYDIAGQLGVEVRFIDIPSMEGMYLYGPQPSIFVSSLRPPGRRSFTCAHEIGHHCLGHGTLIDQFVEARETHESSIEEFAADCFAGSLLMPKLAVTRAFNLRGWKPERCTPDQAYVLSNLFGVGYTTLIHHLRSSLLMLPRTEADRLLKIAPRRAKFLAIGWETDSPVWVVDKYWTGRPIDIEVGDLVQFDDGPRIDGDCVKVIDGPPGKHLVRAEKPGIARLQSNSGWFAFVRVARRDYVGRLVYRNEAEVDD